MNQKKKIKDLDEKKLSKTLTKEVLIEKESPKKTPPNKNEELKNEASGFEAHKLKETLPEKSFRGFFFFASLLLIALLVFIYFWIAPAAKITIKPKISILPITQNVLVALTDAVISEGNKNLPRVNGIFVETVVKDSQSYPSTKKTYDITNARGKITLFNETDQPKFLIPSRLSTQSGIILRTQQDLTIPAKQKNRPGKLVVNVVVDAYDAKEKPIGNRGNLDAGTELFFPALRKDSRELYYGKVNRGPLVGGSTLTHYFVGEADIESSKQLFQQHLRAQGLNNLQAEIAKRTTREKTHYILLDKPKLLKSELLKFVFPLDKIDQEQQTFKVSGELKLSGIVFDETTMISLLEKQLKATQDHRKKLINIDKNSINFRLLTSEFLDEEKWLKLSVSILGVETLNLEAKNKFAILWKEKIIQEILGKNILEVRGILTNHPEIENVINIKVSPFWVKSIPHLLDQIELKIQN